MITRHSIETAYSFLHQKLNVYRHSTLDWQRDDIEWAVGTFADSMSPELLALADQGESDFLKTHSRFENDLIQAVERLENLIEQQ